MANEIAKAGYEAYRASKGFKGDFNATLARWDELPEAEQNAWIAVFDSEQEATIDDVQPSAGAFGDATEITITGEFLTGTSSVMIDDLECEIVSVSDTEVVARVPDDAPADTYDVTITKVSEDTVTSSSAFEVVALTVFTSVSPSSGWVDGEESLTIVGVNFTGVTDVTIGGEACTMVSVDSDTSITCKAPAGLDPGAYDLVITKPTSIKTQADAFTVAVPITFTSITPDHAVTAVATPLSIVGTGFTGVTSVKIDDVACTSLVVVSSTHITCNQPTSVAAGTYDLKIAKPSGTLTVTDGFIVDAGP